ncbi:hypothetical protein BVX93_01800 [bacterium B13(2017)]|nr:hypothetical protein BVX93_01800 [bacterium B13(2017)]
MNDNHELEMLLKELKCKILLADITPSDRKAVLNFLKDENQARKDYRLQRLLATCGIPKYHMRTFDQLQWHFNPKIPQEQIMAFKNSPWIEHGHNLVLIGDTGIGKSHIAKALCYDSICRGHSTYFITVFDLLTRLRKTPYLDNSIAHYGKNVRVLCLDELGYVCHKKEETDLLFQIISKRSECLPTIVTSNLPPKEWGSIFSGPAASAILDRLSYNGSFLTWEGKSYRLTKLKK